MVSRLLVTYAILSYLKEKGKTQLDLYVPLVCQSIIKHSAKTVSRDNLQHWLSEDYGLSQVYKGVLDSLLSRMSGTFLERDKGVYYVKDAEIQKATEGIDGSIDERVFSDLSTRVKQFADAKYSLVFTEELILQGIMDFLHTRDGDMLFEQDQLSSVLQKQKEGKTTHTKVKYIISRYILWSKENEPEVFKLFAKLSMGHALTSVITMKDVSAYVGKMKGVIVALDSPILFSLIGLAETSKRELIEELISILKKQEVEFVVFEKHFQEFKQTISSAIHSLYTKNYNLEKASRLLRYAVRTRMNHYALSLKLQQVDSILDKWSIRVTPSPAVPSDYSEIDIAFLEDLMINRYTENHPEMLDDIQRRIIETDADVVSYIYRIRGNDVATSLKNSKAILVTTNTALAYASKHPNLSSVRHIIPVCMTDVFLSTVLWFNYPDSDGSFNEKALICECYNNITVSDELLNRFYHDVEKLNEESPFTEEQLLEANTSDVVIEMLENKTFNDPELYTEMTAAEIMEEIDFKKNLKIKKLAKTIEEKDEKGERISKRIAGVLFLAIWIVLVLVFFLLKVVDYSSWNETWRIVWNTLSLFPALWGLLCWNNLIWPKTNIINHLSRIVKKILY